MGDEARLRVQSAPRERCNDYFLKAEETDKTSALTGSTQLTAGLNGQLSAEIVLLRKEVIQPHLPVRLPCYDFTPIANPTFGSSFPKGLGH